MKSYMTTTPDPAWLSAIAARRAVLWLGQSLQDASAEESESLLRLLAHPWLAVYIEPGAGLPSLTESVDAQSIEPYTLRNVTGDPDAVSLAPNRVPVFRLPAQRSGNPLDTLHRLKMLQRIPSGAVVFAVSKDPDSDSSGVLEAAQVSTDIAEMTIVSNGDLVFELPCRRFVHWLADVRAFDLYVQDLAAPRDLLRRAATIAIATDSGVTPVDVSGAIDPSSPLLARFRFIPHEDVVTEVTSDEALVQELIAGSSESWRPYAAGVPYDRTGPYKTAIKRLLREFDRRGPESTCTAWLEAEQASGASTLLKTLLFGLAREGMPVLLARQETVGFDFQQISAFCRAAAPVLDAAGGRLGRIPWIIAFDAEHATRDAEFIGGLAQGLRRLGHLALVLAVRPILPSAPRGRRPALGETATLGPRLQNIVTRDEAEALGQHLNAFLPTHQRRSPRDWRDFVTQSERLTGEGRQSLFWLALRFWLLRLPGSEEPLRQWLAGKLYSATVDSDPALTGLAEVAVLSAHRILMPSQLLSQEALAGLRSLMHEPAQTFGLTSIWSTSGESFALAHPLVAEEILRICASDADLLSRLMVSQCNSVFDLQLELFERLLSRGTAGDPAVLPVVEDIVTSALRVDPRESPRNYLARDRVVMAMERAPDSVFDGSQLFLHHLAKGRRHLAADPPTGEYWTDPAHIREQLDLAEHHLADAFTFDTDLPDERRDSDLNLHVTSALTFDVRARFESGQGDPASADVYQRRAQDHYLKAQALDPDNTYVLENFARFKLREARETTVLERRVALAIEAVTLLEWELAVDEQFRRREAIFETLVSAYGLLRSEVGLDALRSMAEHGDEAASIAVARYTAYPDRFDEQSDEEGSYRDALVILKNVPPAQVTWRSRLLVYQLVSRDTPRDFPDRLDACDELAAMTDFPWPLQTKLEYAILMFQMGRHQDGKRAFAEIRDSLASRTGSVSIPEELRYLADPKSAFSKPLKTSLIVTNTSSVGRNFYGIPQGWGSVDIPFRPYLFPRQRIVVRDDLDCLIQFTQFGPQAVPVTEA